MLQKLRYIFNRKDKFKISGLLVMMVLGSFLELSGVAAFMPFIEIVMSPENISKTPWLQSFYEWVDFSSMDFFIAFLAISLSLIYIVKNVYLGVLQNSILKFSYETRKKLAVRLLTAYMDEPYTFHRSKNVAELQRSLQVDTNQFMILVNNVLQIIAEIMVCLVLGIYLFDTSHSITGIVLFLLVVCVGFFLYVSKKVSLRLGEQNQFYNAKLIQWINQALGGIKEVKVLRREDYFVRSYEENYKKLIWGARINELLSALPRYIVEAVCITGLLVAVIGKMFWGFQGNEVSDFIPQIAVCAVAAFRLLPSVGKINAFANSVLYCIPSLNLIYEDLKQIEGYGETQRRSRSEEEIRADWIFQDAVRVRNVTYRYPDATEPVLKEVNIEIPKETTVAFIGASGAGKTTLADIILGLLPPEKGEVLVDKMNIYDNLGCWYQHLGYIPQTIYLSDDTIRNNIAFGISEQDIDEKAIWDSLERAQLASFVRGLEKGLDTFVGDRGIRLSGGQRQRVGIARALYHDPEILVLDEATSALDNETEKAVMESIENLKGKKTMLIIAHRLSTIKNADIIYEISEGRAVRKDKDQIDF